MQDFVSAIDAAKILNCTRANIDRLQLLKKLTPVSTVYPKYYFKREEVLNLKKSRQAKKLRNV